MYSFNNDYLDDGLKIASTSFCLPYKSRPILFSTPMVHALLNGTKTQTRRVIKDSFNGCWTGGVQGHPCPNDPIVFHPGEVITNEEGNQQVVDFTDVVEAHFHCSTMDKTARCPYGKVGDRLWVRETWAYLDIGPEDSGYVYRASENGEAWQSHDPAWKWKPSIFMPREACRIELEITDIRAERLLVISEEDAIAEGIEKISKEDSPMTIWQSYSPDDVESFGRFDSVFTAQESYWSLWDSINGKQSHLVNPWVWAITFKVTVNEKV